jgi:diguanylate cyclase (GGDEF)-like protein
MDIGAHDPSVIVTISEADSTTARQVSTQQLPETPDSLHTDIRQPPGKPGADSTHDLLTGCLTRRAFFEKYEGVFMSALQEGHKLSCIRIDIDMLREINHRYGHIRGDEVIQAVANSLQRSFRPTDTIFRYGGEEFCVMLPGIKLSLASHLAERARLNIEKLNLTGTTNASGVAITASLGVSSIEQGPASLARLIDQTGKALKQSRNSGGNHVTVWQTETIAGASPLQGAFIPGITPQPGQPVHTDTPAVPAAGQPGDDRLTGLSDRRQFQEHILEAVQSGYGNGLISAVMILDMDMFKRINNALGYSAGDELLEIIGSRLSKTLRGTDSLARLHGNQPDSAIYSLGGDEIGILLKELGSIEATAQVVHRIIDSVTERIDISGNEIHLTCSIGISLYPEHGREADVLLKNACTALYYAKLEGHNSYQFYDENLSNASIKSLQLENELRHAIENNALELYYQPKVDLGTGRVSSMEALLRWQHPQFGMIPPDKFIPVAEATGLITQLGYQTIETACRQIRQWQSDGYESIRVAVNLSAVQFRQKDLLEKIHHLLREYGVAAKQLEIEITESTIMADIDAASSKMRGLHHSGIHISIDDFGTGYSSLNHLKRFPINTVKIDHSFIRDITTDADDAAIVGAIIELAHKMGLAVVAEGVETVEQLELLQGMHCNEIQGFLFSQPLPPDEASGLLGETIESRLGAGKMASIAS